MIGFVVIAAQDTVEELKKDAEFVCTGSNDEVTIQKAIDRCISEDKNIYLLNGTYNIDAFYDFGDNGPICAICFPNAGREIKFIGQNYKYGKNGLGVKLYVSKKALSLITDEVDVIRSTWTDRGIGSGSALYIENVCISASHNQSPVRLIDLRRCDRPELKNIGLNAYVDLEAGLGNPPPVPVRGCIGLTMTDGSNAHFSNYTNISASGFYEGIQVGGEHVVMINCAAIMCYYGYTFGNYKINCGANHPITMINCMDERNVNLPLFGGFCGDDDGQGGRIRGGQEVTMISFNIERFAEQTPGKRLGDLMKEEYPGMWCGNIGFTAQPAWCHTNETDFQLWESDGSGFGFTTKNTCHKFMCSTKERLSYYPSYGQQIYDTDINKLLICVDPDKKLYVDCFGK